MKQWSDEGFGIMWVGIWATGRGSQGYSGKGPAGVGKGMPIGKEHCRAQWTSGLKTANHSQGGSCSPVLTTASQMPASSR